MGAAFVLILVGCDYSTTADGASSSVATTAVTAPNPAEEYYDLLKDLDPNEIPDSLRRDFPWAFDPASGHLVDFRDAYYRAAAVDCRANCVNAGYVEMVYRLHLQDRLRS